ncbi:M56 family metallopeptidase [Paenibacillus sp. 2KB_20]|uniref:M56 family metallopeptidase n=1 Tax=Paenibacillus sp. 2KB_20 TaxID=3232977 RepID=UPI003F97F341
MQGFLVTLIHCSVSMSLITLAYSAIRPLLSKRYAAKWMYRVWLLIAAGWIFPFRPRIDQLILHVSIPDIPVAFAQSMPFMDVSDMGNARGTIPLWWLLAAIWGCGVVSIVLYHALRHGRFIKTVRRWSEPVIDAKVLGILNRVRSELRITKPVGLSVCESVTNPMLVGFFRPVILLPPMKLSDDVLSLILKHELIHYKRHDLWYKAMILTATAIHWFNPVVYLMAKAAAKQCEISCDALVLQNADHQHRMQYGETIIAVVRNGAKLQTGLSTNFYGGKKDLKNRISLIMDQKGKKAGILIFCMALAGIIWTGSALTDEANADDQQASIGTETVTWSYDSESPIDNEVTRLKELLRRYANNLDSSNK